MLKDTIREKVNQCVGVKFHGTPGFPSDIVVSKNVWAKEISRGSIRFPNSSKVLNAGGETKIDTKNHQFHWQLSENYPKS
jgi:hypothetical protein